VSNAISQCWTRGLLAAATVAFGMSTAAAVDITGAGATFPYPVYAKWAEAYKQKTNVGMNYQSIGSGGGIAQIKAKAFHPMIYWATIIATTTVGTTLADFADRSLGIGYAGGASLLFVLLMASLAIWYLALGSVSIESVSSPRAEMHYWLTIMFSQTLGTALGDWTADTAGLGYGGGAIVFSALLAIVAAAYLWTRTSRTLLFWAAFILTRPLGAVLGDFLDKPVEAGGLALSRYAASAVLLAAIAACIVIFPQRAATRSH